MTSIPFDVSTHELKVGDVFSYFYYRRQRRIIVRDVYESRGRKLAVFSWEWNKSFWFPGRFAVESLVELEEQSSLSYWVMT